MKILAVAILLLPTVVLADPPEVRIIAFSTNGITYSSTETNIHTQLQFRWDLRTTSAFPTIWQSWHTWGWPEADTFMSTHTNTLSFDAISLAALRAQGGGATFFRVVASSNGIPSTTIAYEMIVTNVADVTMSNILVTLGGAQETFQANALAPGEGTEPFVFNFQEVPSDIIDLYGRWGLYLVEDGAQWSKEIYPRAQRFTLVLTNGAYEIINRDANN